ncbi:MAG: CAAX prenyl protease-related protein [Acidobacteriota bacterium]|nr:CAAX prenyl protease-related protein [Acidobacteriota bacterium]
MTGHPVVPYVLPFAAFLALLGIQQIVPVPQSLRFILIAAILVVFSRGVLRFRLVNPLGSILLGIGVFAIWIGPDVLFPGWRAHWLFSNSALGQPVSSMSANQKLDGGFLFFRVLTSVVTVPILEELFWRAWLMRWLIARDFERVPLGTYNTQAFWIVAILFATEHGSYWEVGLIAGAVYNWWIVRTRNLWDCILAHAVTNLCLAAYVVARGQWQYWL